MRIHAASLAIFVSLFGSVYADSAVHVVDGDTIDVDGTRYRLHGIDAPEAGQYCTGIDGRDWSCGHEAIRFIEKITDGKSVECDNRGQDGYGRTISVCTAGGVEINALMIQTSMAWAFRKYSEDYVDQEEAARERRVGVWQAPTEAAWDFRAHKWDAALSGVPDRTCPIKGNINRKNEHIYHLPWSKDFGKTKIDLARGEKWFCSEEEAIAAGWRAPLWEFRSLLHPHRGRQCRASGFVLGSKGAVLYEPRARLVRGCSRSGLKRWCNGRNPARQV